MRCEDTKVKLVDKLAELKNVRPLTSVILKTKTDADSEETLLATSADVFLDVLRDLYIFEEGEFEQLMNAEVLSCVSDRFTTITVEAKGCVL